MKYLECRFVRDDNFDRWLYRYDFEHGFLKQACKFVPIIYKRYDGSSYVVDRPYDWRDYDLRSEK